MLNELLKGLIGRHFGQNQTSVNVNGLPPQHTIVDEEIFHHNGIKYLAMRIRVPDEPDYVQVGVVEREKPIVRDSGASGVIRHVMIIDPQKVEGLADILRNTGFSENIKYHGKEEVYKLES